MSHSKATTDNGKELHLYSRIGMYNEKVLSFFNAAGSDYDFTDVGLEIGIKKNRGDDDFITLIEGNGITITGNDVHFVYDEEQSATFKERPYYWQLRRTIDGNKKVWLNGDHDWHNGKFDAFSDSGDTIQINDDGDIINVTINEGGGITQSKLDAALALKADLISRVQSVVSAATVTPNADEDDEVKITSQAVSLLIDNPSGTPTDGQGMGFSLKDNGVQRAISFGNKYRPFSTALPLVTTVSKWMRFAAIYNSTDDMWDVLPYVVEI